MVKKNKMADGGHVFGRNHVKFAHLHRCVNINLHDKFYDERTNVATSNVHIQKFEIQDGCRLPCFLCK